MLAVQGLVRSQGLAAAVVAVRASGEVNAAPLFALLSGCGALRRGRVSALGTEDDCVCGSFDVLVPRPAADGQTGTAGTTTAWWIMSEWREVE